MSTPVVSIESTAALVSGAAGHDLQRHPSCAGGRRRIAPVCSLQPRPHLLQGKSPLTVTRHIEQQKSVEGLASAQKKIMELIPLLLREGARVSHITRVVSEINDR
jgi:hypothetical protein